MIVAMTVALEILNILVKKVATHATRSLMVNIVLIIVTIAGIIVVRTIAMAISIMISIKALRVASVMTAETIVAMSTEIMSVVLIVVTIAEMTVEMIVAQIRVVTSALKMVHAAILTELFLIHLKILIQHVALVSLRCQKVWNGQCFLKKIASVCAVFQRSMLKILVFIFLQLILCKKKILNLH